MSEKELRAIISSNITKLLLWNEKSQTDLAKYLNVSQATVSNWCKGVKIPRMDKFDLICSYFNISRDDLFNDLTFDRFKSERRTQKLMHFWRLLNPDGQDQLINQAELLTLSEKYTAAFPEAEEDLA